MTIAILKYNKADVVEDALKAKDMMQTKAANIPPRAWPLVAAEMYLEENFEATPQTLACRIPPKTVNIIKLHYISW